MRYQNVTGLTIVVAMVNFVVENTMIIVIVHEINRYILLQENCLYVNHCTSTVVVQIIN